MSLSFVDLKRVFKKNNSQLRFSFAITVLFADKEKIKTNGKFRYAPRIDPLSEAVFILRNSFDLTMSFPELVALGKISGK